MSIESQKVVVYTKDDNKRNLIGEILKKREIIEVFNPSTKEECVELLQEGKYLLVLDWNSDTLSDVLFIMDYACKKFYTLVSKVSIFIFSEEAIQGVITEYSVSHSYVGEFNEEAIDNVFGTIFEKNVIDQELNATLSQILFQPDATDESILESLEELYKKYTFNPVVCNILASYYFKLAYYSKIPDILEPLIIHEDQSVHELHLLGMSLLKNNKKEEGISFLQKANYYNPYNEERLIILGEAFLDSQNFELAKTVYEQLKVISPDSPDLKIGLVKIQLLEGDINDASVNLEKFLSSEEIVSYINDVAIFLIQKEDMEKYEDRIFSLYYKACYYARNDKQVLSRVCFNLALAYYKMSDLPKSHYFFYIASILDPGYGKAVSNTAILQLKLDKDKIIPVDLDDVTKSIFKFAN